MDTESILDFDAFLAEVGAVQIGYFSNWGPQHTEGKETNQVVFLFEWHINLTLFPYQTTPSQAPPSKFVAKYITHVVQIESVKTTSV